MLDAITETISHFIGHFHLSAEEMRLRSEYERFRHEVAARDEPAPSEPQPTKATTFDLGGFDPGLDWRPEAPSLDRTEVPSEGPGPWEAPGPALASVLPDQPVAEPALPVATHEALPGPVVTTTVVLPPPSSIATATVQAVVLHDDDAIGDVDAAGFAPPESFAPDLGHLVEVAHGLSALEIPAPTGEAPWIDVAAAIKAQVAAVEARDAQGLPGGAEAQIVADPEGVVVDGRAADAMPVLADHLPAALAQPAGEGDSHGDAWTGVPDSVAAPPPDEQPDGLHVVAGANALVNEAAVTSAWIDAGVILVKGDVTQIDAITQVNALSDLDDLGTGVGPQAASDLLNAARIDRAAAPAHDASSGPGVLPATWAVTRIEGDLTSVNWVRQQSFATDHDRALITSTGSSTFVGLGGNEAVNVAQIAELGFRYDLIVVGGSLYDVSAVTQTNVLLDDDRVVGTAGGAGVSGGDNTLFNAAAIQSTGLDTFGQLTSPLKGVLDAVVEGAATMPPFLAEGGLFLGAEALRVLYVAGDLVTVNLVEQINVLGDSDQVRLASEAAVRAAGEGATVVTGSNLLANVATVHEVGIDSVVMAGGGIYTDALIHQAGFLDAEGPDMGLAGGAPAGLASEAVAFLADGMIDGPAGEGAGHGGGHAGPPPMDGASLDVMHTMLA